MSIILGYICNLGLDAGKDKLKDKADEQVMRIKLMEYLGRQEKLNFNCTKDEEIDFEGLFNYISNDLIDDAKARFFGDITERESAHKSIIGKSIAYANTNTKISRVRVTKIVTSSLNILKKFYEMKVNKELLFIASRIEDTIICETNNQTNIISSQLSEISNKIDSSSKLSLEHNLNLAECGKIDEVGKNLSSFINTISTTHPVPGYGFRPIGVNCEMLSVPLSKEAEKKRPPRFNIISDSVIVGSKEASDIYCDNIFDYSYRHQIPVIFNIKEATKFLGEIADPTQIEAEALQGKEMSIHPKPFPKASPYSIKFNDEVLFDYILFRTKEILDNGTLVITNEEQKNRNFTISFNANLNKIKTDFNISPFINTNIAELEYRNLVKKISSGGQLEFKSLEHNETLLIATLQPFNISNSIDVEIEFLKKIIKIEKYFKVTITIPTDISIEDTNCVDYIHNIIDSGVYSSIWSSFKFQYALCDEARKDLLALNTTAYRFEYTFINQICLFNQEFSLNCKRIFKSATINNLPKLKEKVAILDNGDTISITLIPDEMNGDNTYIDELYEDNLEF
ncbi:MAG: hypothetical protein R3Y35_08265 [Clostridia bacterium]